MTCRMIIFSRLINIYLHYKGEIFNLNKVTCKSIVDAQIERMVPLKMVSSYRS